MSASISSEFIRIKIRDVDPDSIGLNRITHEHLKSCWDGGDIIPFLKRYELYLSNSKFLRWILPLAGFSFRGYDFCSNFTPDGMLKLRADTYTIPDHLYLELIDSLLIKSKSAKHRKSKEICCDIFSDIFQSVNEELLKESRRTKTLRFFTGRDGPLRKLKKLLGSEYTKLPPPYVRFMQNVDKSKDRRLCEAALSAIDEYSFIKQIDGIVYTNVSMETLSITLYDERGRRCL